MNKSVKLVVIVVVIVGGLFLLNQMKVSNKTGPGKVIVSITDAAVDMTNISEVKMTVNKVELHSETTGWVTISSTARTYNLLELKAKGESAFAAQASSSAGTYNQIRATISNITVITKTGTVTSAKLPSNHLILNGDIVVKSGETTSVNLDFLASASLHTTGTGLYIFAPVVHLEVRGDATVGVSKDNNDKDKNDQVEIQGGRVETEVEEGMDVNGEVKEDFKLDTNAKVRIENGIIKVN